MKNPKRPDNSRPVYSTSLGRLCPSCGRALAAGCGCRRAGTVRTGDGIVRVRREVKGRGGKTVTTLSGVPLAGEGLLRLASELKSRCGAGGTVKDGVIEIQGDRRDLVVAELEARGYKVKLAGG